jgi:hypothetical protein
MRIASSMTFNAPGFPSLSKDVLDKTVNFRDRLLISLDRSIGKLLWGNGAKIYRWQRLVHAYDTHI